LAERENSEGAESAKQRAERQLGAFVRELRPQLHRYCARMVGSVIDGEDVLQETLLKALEALLSGPAPDNPKAWLFRIAHNSALDHLRRRIRHEAAHSDEDIEMIIAPVALLPDPHAAAASLRTLMRLPVSQRSAVILRDVLGHSVEEAAEVMGITITAAKGDLQRGRARLRQLAREPEDVRVPPLPESERARLVRYVELFNARDFDAIRAMLAEDVHLDLVNRLQRHGRAEVSEYFHRYSLSTAWHCVPGLVEGQLAILMFDPNDLEGRPTHFVLLEWTGERIANIRDFHFASYAVDGAEIAVLSPRADT
jgi:RNA polymerase sigma-70 factor (ECF subfamily)